MKIILLLFSITVSYVLMAQPYTLNYIQDTTPDERAANCTPPTSSSFLELNNVKALIHTGGNLWQIAGQNFCQ